MRAQYSNWLSTLQSCAQLGEFESFTILRHFNLPTESFVYVAGHCISSVGLSVSYENSFGRGGHAFQPTDNFSPIGMR